MTKLLTNFIDKYELKPIEAAKVLRIQKSKLSEYLAYEHGDTEKGRTLPPYIGAHIETFLELTEGKAKEIIKRRSQ